MASSLISSSSGSGRWHQLALLTAAGRVGIGAALTLAAPRAWRALTGRAPVSETVLAVRMMGARDLVLGLGALLAARRGRPTRGWLEASAVADAADAALLASTSALPPGRRGPAAVVPAAATVVSVVGARQEPG